jgi:hypothetical protein
VRKASFPVLWAGLATAILAHRSVTIGPSIDDAGAIPGELLSPLAGVVIAVLMRAGAGVAALALAYPLAGPRERALPARDYRGARLGELIDRIHVARALRSLRWTHHVRQRALARLGPRGRAVGRLDPVLDVAGIALFLLLVVVAVAASATAGAA